MDVVAMVRRPTSNSTPAQVTQLMADVRDPGTLVPHLRPGDCVVHLACLPLEASNSQPRLAFATNTLGTFNVLEASRVQGVARVVLASSAVVYGPPLTVPMSEDHPTRPTSPYGASKLAGEAFAGAYAHHYERGLMTLRLFNVFGFAADGSPRGTVETIFSQRAAAGLPLRIDGHPDDAKDFVHVHDVVRAVLAACSTSATGVCNIGSGKATSLRSLAAASGVGDADLMVAAPTSRDAETYTADIAMAQKLLGFQPGMGVEEFVAMSRSAR